MQDSINITLVQYDIHWMDAKANTAFLENQLKNLKTDLIVLPEMFNTGFSMSPNEVAETMEGETIAWLLTMAKKLDCMLCGSLCIEDNRKYYNRFVFVSPESVVNYYDKKHLFGYGGEDEVFAPGKESVIIDYKGFKIKPFICYDLRFPVWSRNVEDYDIALYVANWPAKRAFAWNSLLTARAIENMSYVVAVNRIGIDGNQLRYQGDSQVIGPLGSLVVACKGTPIVQQVELKRAPLVEARNQFKFLEDQDKFNIL